MCIRTLDQAAYIIHVLYHGVQHLEIRATTSPKYLLLVVEYDYPSDETAKKNERKKQNKQTNIGPGSNLMKMIMNSSCVKAVGAEPRPINFAAFHRS